MRVKHAANDNGFASAASGGRLSNVDIAVFALYRLGGAKGKVHLEEIAEKCHELAQTRFSWELPRYQKYGPDKKVTSYALQDACKDKAGKIVQSINSRAKGGQKFQLTLSGVKWIKQNEARIARELGQKSSLAPLREVRKILRDIKGDAAFRRFRAEGSAENLSAYDLVDFLGCSFEPSPSAICGKFAEMKMKAELVEDTEISDFLRACETRFADLLPLEMVRQH
jgi:hypothetical protein